MEEKALVLSAVTEAQKAILTQSTPKDVIMQREGPGGMVLSYVEHSWVTEQLNLAFNWAWSWEIVESRLFPAEDPHQVAVLGKLTVHSPNGDLVKMQYGSSDVKRTKQGKIISIGDELKSASSDALKKAASLLGLALDLYSSTVHEKAGNGTSARKARAATPATAFWTKANELGVDRDTGQAIVKENGGDFEKALRVLETQYRNRREVRDGRMA